jgi:hypothetical protein
MVGPGRMLEAIRRELAERVLPALTDDRARSSVIAAMGILKDLAPQVREDDGWIADSLALLEPAAARWWSDVDSLDRDMAALLAPARKSPVERREQLLGALEQVIAYLWRTGAAPELLQDIRVVLRADVELETKRLG